MAYLYSNEFPDQKMSAEEIRKQIVETYTRGMNESHRQGRQEVLDELRLFLTEKDVS